MRWPASSACSSRTGQRGLRRLPAQGRPRLRKRADGGVRDCGFIPRLAQTASQMQTILALVAGGLGIALVPRAMRAVAMEGVRYLQVRKGNASLRYALGRPTTRPTRTRRCSRSWPWRSA
ncbi:hypothetical protein HK414_07595 [Ramlibacter terrae]|uniref:LysR substrate-binding domain-containing protein n=1 Tax=Ramlibacter terrae TaxID=2732511 RepID=A0ABX6P9K2_9BURK|nr:hypothetical protein HK414_07595 [Ramlibacter terrae]